MLIDGKHHGSSHWMHKHPFSLVEKIRDEYELKKVSQIKLAAKYNIDKRTINDWIHYRTRVYG